MRRTFCIVIALLIILMIPAAVLADYVTFYDVINDVKLLFGSEPDAFWATSPDAAKAAAGSLEGFSCSEAGETLVCEKNHWSGEFNLTLFFANDKPAALECTFTGSSIQDLNYPPNTAYIYNAEDLGNRLKSYGLVPGGAAQTEGNLFEGTETNPYGPVYEIGGNTLLQAGYNSKSASNPKFSLAFIAKAVSGDFVLPAEPAAAASKSGYADEEIDQVPFDEVMIGYPKPEKIPAAKEEDFYGSWLFLFVNDGTDPSETVEGAIPAMFRADLVMDNFDFVSYNIAKGEISEITEEKTVGPFETEFRDGKLYTRLNDMVFEMNDNGMISSDIRNGWTVYMAKVEDGYFLYKTLYDGHKISNADSGSDSEDTAAGGSAGASGISLTVSEAELEVGVTVEIRVSAPGADGIRLYRKSEWDDTLWKEVSGDTMSYKFASVMPDEETYYAAASYGGVWSDERSNEKTITFLPATLLRFTVTQMVREGDPIPVDIFTMKDVDQYTYTVTDAQGNVVRELTAKETSVKLDPLPIGKYKLTVSCSGETDHSGSADFEVSATEQTGQYTKVDEEPNAGPASGNTAAAAPAVSPDDEAIGTWALKYYTALIDGKPDMDNVFSAGELRNSPLNTDTVNVILNADGYFAEVRQRGGELSGYCGTWRRDGSDIYLRYSDGSEVGPYYFYDNDMSVIIPREENKAINLQFTRCEPISDPEMLSYINSLFGEAAETAGSADENDPEVLFRRGNAYSAGDGVEKDPEQAVYWWKQAAELGHAEAQNELANAYFNGLGVEKDQTEAFNWYTKSAEQGYANSQFNLGVLYSNGTGTAVDYDQAFFWLKKSAEQDYYLGQFGLANAYYNGQGTEKDDAQALYWWEKSAENGYVGAQKNVAFAYYGGIGTAPDYEKVIYWFGQAAEQGDAVAQNNLGAFYHNGDIVEKNDELSVYWFRQAAESGFSDGQVNLADRYANGEGVEQDLEQAVYWYTQAAEQGNVNAQNSLAMAYIHGEGVEQDAEQGVYWLTQAAEQGDAVAQARLGLLYNSGFGVEQNDELAKYWLGLAAAQGLESAQQKLLELYPEE